jgi:YVTN family beta-propeller protein
MDMNTASSLRRFAKRGLLIAFIALSFHSIPAAASSRVYVTSFGGIISVYDSALDKIIANLLFVPGLYPEAIALTPDGAYLYVTVLGSNSVHVFATATNEFVRSIPVQSDPRAIAFTPNGAFAYVVNSGSDTVSVIATAINNVVATIRLVTGSRPTALAITPDGTRVYVANTGTSNVSVIDVASNREIVGPGHPIGLTGPPLAIVMRPDGRLAYVHVSQYYADRGNYIAAINLSTDRVPNVTADGAGEATAMTMANDGSSVYVTFASPNVGASGTVSLLSESFDCCFALVGSFPVGRLPSAIAIERDGGSLGYVVNTLSDTMSVFSTQSNQSVGQPVPVGQLPQNLAILSHPDPIINFNITFNAVAKFGSLFNLVGLLSTLSAPVDDPALVASVTWDFYGDGSVVSTTSTLNAQFTYTQAGDFAPKVTVLFSDGTQASRSTMLHVQSTAEAIGTTESLVDWLVLPDGLTNSLDSKLEAAAGSAARGNYGATCGQIRGFENDLRSLVTNGEIDDAASAPAVGQAEAIRVSLGCGQGA